MFTSRFFSPRYWASRYWAKVGSNAVVITPDCIAALSSTIDCIAALSSTITDVEPFQGNQC